jgi:hypothetical protein
MDTDTDTEPAPRVIRAECDREHIRDVIASHGCVIDRELFGFGAGCLMLSGARCEPEGPVRCEFLIADVGGTADEMHFEESHESARMIASRGIAPRPLAFTVYRRATLDGIEFRELDDPACSR